MGPSFNFYKFKGTQDLLKTKFKETTQDVKWVDAVLRDEWGEPALGRDKFGQSRHHGQDDASSTYDAIMNDIMPIPKAERDSDVSGDMGGGHHDISILQRTMDMLEQQNQTYRSGDNPGDGQAQAFDGAPARKQQTHNHPYLHKSKGPKRMEKKPYVPKFVREIEKERETQR